MRNKSRRDRSRLNVNKAAGMGIIYGSTGIIDYGTDYVTGERSDENYNYNLRYNARRDKAKKQLLKQQVWAYIMMVRA